MKVNLVVDSLTGYPTIVKEATHFDEHPLGEGHDRSRIVELERPNLDMDEWFEWIPHPTLEKVVIRRPIVKFNTTVLRSPGFSVASKLNNKVGRVALQKVILSDYEADFERETKLYDTRLNSILTVGTSQTHATISNAIIAMSGGDHIFISATAAGAYDENLVLGTKPSTLSGTIDSMGVIVEKSTGVLWSSTISDCHNIYNMTFRGIGGNSSTLISFISSHSVLRDCKIRDGGTGFLATGAEGQRIENTVIFDCVTGIDTNIRGCAVIMCTIVDCTTDGLELRADGGCQGNLVFNCNPDYSGGTSTPDRSQNNISSDGTEIGPGGAATADTAMFVNYAADDFRLVLPATGALLKGTPPLRTDAFGNLRKLVETDNAYFTGFSTPDPIVATVPGKPLMGVLVPISGQVTIPVTAVLPTDEIFARTRIDNIEPWDAENPTFSRIGSGNIVYTGLTDVRREFGLYAKSGKITSDWDTDFALVGAAAVAATRPLAKYKVAIQNFFLNSSNFLDWIQTVDAGGSTAGRVVLGYGAKSAPPDIATKGPKAFISGRAFGADNDGAEKAYIATFEILAEVIWFMDHLDDAPFTVEENFLDLLLDEALGLGFDLETTLSGTIDSVNIAKVELDDGTEGQGRRERRSVFEFLITYPMTL